MLDTVLVDQLSAAIPNLPTTDHDFANSLVSQYARFKRWSPRQELFVKKLIAKAAAPAQGDRVRIDLGNFDALIAMFVGTRLKQPEVHLLNGEQEIILSRASSRARVPGSIDVKTAGGYGVATWYGRILETGQFEVSPRDEPGASIIALLHRFAAEPLKVAAEFGFKTGRCCFCNIKLTDPKSVANGYGPVCGKRYTAYLSSLRKAA